MTNTQEVTELTTKGRLTYAEAYAQEQLKSMIKKERKALKAVPESLGDDAIVSMRVWSTGEMIRYQNRGWELQANLSQGRGAGRQSYLMKKARGKLVLDLPAES